MSSIHSYRLIVSILLGAFLHATTSFAQQMDHNAHGQSGPMTSAAMHNPSGDHGKMPQLPGQDAFGAIQEIVDILSADPATDWSQVNINAPRAHLVDMNLATLGAETKQKSIKGGVETLATSSGRTRKAIQGTLLAHSRDLDKIETWNARASKTPQGARLVVTSTNPAETARIRALGLFGLLATGSHHQPHHLGMATGQMVHGE